MIIWLLIIGLSVIVFVNRYVFLEPKFTFQLPVFIEKMLKYAAPCLMISVCIPIIFYNGEQFREMTNNIYLVSAILTIFITLKTRKMLLSIVMSLLIFYSLSYFSY